MSDDKKKEHVIYERNKKLHNPVGEYDNGSCCIGHHSKYTPCNSCSYRWQGCKRALDKDMDRDLYGDLTPGIRARSPEVAKTMMAAGLLVGLSGGVQIHQKKKHEYQYVIGEPFLTPFSPWSNQVHHLLPNATLRQAIETTASGYLRAEDAMVRGLLTHKYNINLWKNMMILPTEDKVGCQIHLPSHLGKHNEYSAEVLPKVMQIFRPYKAVVRAIKQQAKHPKPKMENIVKKLDDLAMKLHEAVLDMRPLVAARCAEDINSNVNINTFASVVKTRLGP